MSKQNWQIEGLRINGVNVWLKFQREGQTQSFCTTPKKLGVIFWSFKQTRSLHGAIKRPHYKKYPLHKQSLPRSLELPHIPSKAHPRSVGWPRPTYCQEIGPVRPSPREIRRHWPLRSHFYHLSFDRLGSCITRIISLEEQPCGTLTHSLRIKALPNWFQGCRYCRIIWCATDNAIPYNMPLGREPPGRDLQ